DEPHAASTRKSDVKSAFRFTRRVYAMLATMPIGEVLKCANCAAALPNVAPGTVTRCQFCGLENRAPLPAPPPQPHQPPPGPLPMAPNPYAMGNVSPRMQRLADPLVVPTQPRGGCAPGAIVGVAIALVAISGAVGFLVMGRSSSDTQI